MEDISIVDEQVENSQNLSEEKQNVLNMYMRKLKSSPIVMKKFLQRIIRVKTDAGWKSFPSTAGSQIARRHHKRAKIHVTTHCNKQKKTWYC